MLNAMSSWCANCLCLARKSERLRSYCDQPICLEEREPFGRVSEWYGEFPKVTAGEVRGLVDSAPRQYAAR